MSIIEFFETLRENGVEFWIDFHRERGIIGRLNLTTKVSYIEKRSKTFQECIDWMMNIMFEEHPEIFTKKEGVKNESGKKQI